MRPVYTWANKIFEITEDGMVQKAGEWVLAGKLRKYTIPSTSCVWVIEEKEIRLFVGAFFPKGFWNKINGILIHLDYPIKEIECENRKHLYYFDKLQQILEH